MLRGVDISGWQHDDPDHPQIDWASTREAGYSFVIIKSTQAADYTNPYLASDVQLAHENRLVIGLYHYAEPGACNPDNVPEDAKAQALYAAGAADGLPLSLGIACDLEEQGAFQMFQLPEWYKTFASTMNALRHHCPLYVNRNYLSQLMGAPFGHRLWLALGSDDLGQIPAGVEPYMVQGGAGATKGFAGDVDQDFLVNARAINPAPPGPVTKPKPVAPPPPPVVKSEEATKQEV